MSMAASSPQPSLGTSGRPMILTGNAVSRGLGQSTGDPQLGPAVFTAVMERVVTAGPALVRAADYLAAQWVFCSQHAPGQMAQLRGIARGYGIAPHDLFAYLHLGVIEDADGGPCAEADGCSVVACQTADAGPVLAKNRDYRGEHRALQRVFLESDPAWGGRRILSVGSLGSPGAFSSGMNSDGLALADTRIGWHRPATGWLRYLLMNEILIRAGTVAQALEFIKSQPHTGGGALVLMDAAGFSATVELGSNAIASRTANPVGGTGIGQTNHFVDPTLFAGRSGLSSDPDEANSRGRFALIESWIADTTLEHRALEQVADFLAAHEIDSRQALCRHGAPDGSQTISASLFACASRTLYFCPGNPCSNDWRMYAF